MDNTEFHQYTVA